MISVTIFENQEEQITRFHCIGHADYAEPGSDIICAGVSVLVYNAINSIELFSDSLFELEMEEKSGLIDFAFLNDSDENAQLLLRSMILGLQGIQEDYGDKYIVLEFKEV